MFPANRLRVLAPEIGRLTALTELYLSENQLRSLPPEIGGLRDLARLPLSRNRLQEPPAALRDLPKLTHLFLHGNPALKLSRRVLGGDPKAGKGYQTWVSASSILDACFGRMARRTRDRSDERAGAGGPSAPGDIPRYGAVAR